MAKALDAFPAQSAETLSWDAVSAPQCMPAKLQIDYDSDYTNVDSRGQQMHPHARHDFYIFLPTFGLHFIFCSCCCPHNLIWIFKNEEGRAMTVALHILHNTPNTRRIASRQDLRIGWIDAETKGYTERQREAQVRHQITTG